MPLAETKDFNALIDNKSVFDEPVKNKQEAHEKPVKISRNDDCTTGNLPDSSCHQNYCKRIGIDLSRQKSTIIPQKSNFAGQLKKDDGATMFFIPEKQQKTVLNFSLDSLNVTE